MTSTQPLHALILEDSAEDAELLVRELQRAGFALEWRRVDSEADYTAKLSPTLDVIFADGALTQFDAPRALELLRQKGLEIPFIAVSGSIGEDLAVAAMREGASDHPLKDRLARLGQATLQALEKKGLQDERRQAEAALEVREAQFRFLVDHISQVFWMIRNVDKPRCKTHGITSAVLMSTGTSKAHAIARPSDKGGSARGGEVRSVLRRPPRQGLSSNEWRYVNHCDAVGELRSIVWRTP